MSCQNFKADNSETTWIETNRPKFMKMVDHKNQHKQLKKYLDTMDDRIKDLTQKNTQLTECLAGDDDNAAKNKSDINNIKDSISNLKGLLSSSKERYQNHLYIYNNNIFKMIYLSSGILTVSFLIFKVVQ